MAYDAVERVLYFVAQDRFFKENRGYALSLETGEATESPLCPELPDNASIGLAFDSRRRSLYLLTPNVLCELDSTFCIQSCVPVPVPVSDVVGLAYDTEFDVFWAFFGGDPPNILRTINHDGEVLTEIDVSFALENPLTESVRGVAYDRDSGTIWVLANFGHSFLNFSRAGGLLSRVSGVPLTTSFFDVGFAWTPDILPDSHVAARAGFHRDPDEGDPSSYPSLYAPLANIFVNGSVGDSDHVVTVPVGEPIEVAIGRVDPSGSGEYVLFAYPGEASSEDLSRFTIAAARRSGVPVFPMPFTDGDITRTRLIVNATRFPALGKGIFRTGPAPTAIVRSRGVGSPRTLTLQGLFTPYVVGATVGNAIVLRIE
jgi:hypothetical protein